jgi:hypothetical protein
MRAGPRALRARALDGLAALGRPAAQAHVLGRRLADRLTWGEPIPREIRLAVFGRRSDTNGAEHANTSTSLGFDPIESGDPRCEHGFCSSPRREDTVRVIR